MDYAVVCAAALGASALTLFSGFGLGTLLLPVFALFFAPEVAVAATAVVHGANNLLKVALFARRADREVVLRFAVPAVLFALLGAAALGGLAGAGPLARWHAGQRQAVVTPLKLVLAGLMAGFALFELHPRFRGVEFDRRWLPLGGALSGFFGGLSGHQGALRSAFLAKCGLPTPAFVGTNAVAGVLVDAARLLVYGFLLVGGPAAAIGASGGWRLVGSATAAAFAGVLLGSRLLRKVTMRGVQRLTGFLLLAVAAALAAGLV